MNTEESAADDQPHIDGVDDYVNDLQRAANGDTGGELLPFEKRIAETSGEMPSMGNVVSLPKQRGVGEPAESAGPAEQATGDFHYVWDPETLTSTKVPGRLLSDIEEEERLQYLADTSEEDRRMLAEMAEIQQRAKYHYTDIVGKEKAQKRRARELQVEEPEEAYGDIFDRIVSGDSVDRRPKFGYLSDCDCGLFYEGTTNGLFGRSGIGKSLILARLKVETMRLGKNVVHHEFDNNSNQMIIRRLVDAGAKREMVVTQLKIVRTDEERSKISEEFTANTGLVTLDALVPAINALGGEVNQPSGTDLALRTLMQPFTVRGATGVFVGHVGHENQDRQAGSHRMYGAMQGALYLAEVVKQPAKGSKGLVTLKLAKDNQGEAGEVGSVAAYATYDSTKGDGSVLVTFSRERDAQALLDEKQAKVIEKLGSADQTREYDITDIHTALCNSPEALSIAELYVRLQDMGCTIPKERLRVRVDDMINRSMVVQDAAASERPATGKGGRPCARYRAVVTPPLPS
ncbi:hypothetical protein [Streptomyces albicerus]|uniref:hypothetical protein n=1 Tax=Streptomyces albicerus TaxID=2569859 RepID=UPI00124AE93F|nr:hypothetical protein [Streptomyces albicerus]